MDNKEPENKDINNQIENQPKKRGRPKKYDFDSSNRREYDQKRYELNKDEMKEKFKQNYSNNKDKLKVKYEHNKDKIIEKQLKRYNENKEELKEKSKELQMKYREGYKLLDLLYKNGHINTTVKNIEKIKKIIIE